MKIVILEGIATSGKSTITRLLREHFSNVRTLVVDETETHEPIMNSMHTTHVDFFDKLIVKYTNRDVDVVIFDRLYLTQSYRADVELNEYAAIENSLNQHNAITVYLKVNNDAIAERINKAAEHRITEWGDYIKTKGATIKEIADTYIEQQNYQLRQLEKSLVPHIIVNTSNHDYDKAITKIIDYLDR